MSLWFTSAVFTLLSEGLAHAQIPTFTSFSPISGVVGTSVTLTGTNFNTTTTNNIMFFDATKATMTAAITTRLTVSVPSPA